mmetsp:Transcript_65404/g.168330  ORF Transcript_65404/g.168330 Transcript_65404/m.168330 type:complete len:201 (+) Transcript_65404:844-1446(+)
MTARFVATSLRQSRWPTQLPCSSFRHFLWFLATMPALPRSFLTMTSALRFVRLHMWKFRITASITFCDILWAWSTFTDISVSMSVVTLLTNLSMPGVALWLAFIAARPATRLSISDTSMPSPTSSSTSWRASRNSGPATVTLIPVCTPVSPCRRPSTWRVRPSFAGAWTMPLGATDAAPRPRVRKIAALRALMICCILTM